MLKRITRKLSILAVLAGMLSGLAPSMLAVRTAHADEASQSGASTALDRSSAPAPKRSEAAKPEPLTSADVQVRSAVVPSDALASGTAGTCLFYITSDMRLTVTPADGTSGTLPTGVNASDWPWYRYAAYIRSVSFDPGVKTSSTLKNAFSSASTTDPEYSQLKSIDLANLDMADLRSVYTAFANDTRLGSVSFKGALNADGITDWTSVFFQSGIESIDLTDVGDAATTVHGLFQGCRSLKTAVIPWAMAHVANAGGMFDGCAGLTSLDTSVWRFGSMTNAVGTLYAQWTPTPPVITVVFHSNDGGTDETVKRVWASNNLDMKAIGLPDGWTKKGFAFHGWNLAADGSGVEYKTGESLYGRMTTATVDLYADWAGLQSTLPQAGGILHAAPVAGLSIMMLGVPLLILARRHRHGHANPPV